MTSFVTLGLCAIPPFERNLMWVSKTKESVSEAAHSDMLDSYQSLMYKDLLGLEMQLAVRDLDQEVACT